MEELSEVVMCDSVVEQDAKRRRVEDESNERKIETLVIHGGVGVDFKAHGAIFPPIFTATSFVQQSLSDHGDYCYGRVQNPTRHAYESALRDLENGSYCAATASGLAAASIILDLLEPGDHVLVHENVYGGSQRLFDTVCIDCSQAL
jgi:cystathionine gamma-lyase